MLNISGPNIEPFCTLREIAFNCKVSKLASSRTYISCLKLFNNLFHAVDLFLCPLSISSGGIERDQWHEIDY